NAQFAVEGGEAPIGGGDLMELLGMGAVGALDVAVELGRAGRKDEEAEAELLAGLLEVGGKLAAAIDLHGPDGEGHAGLEGGEELGGGGGGGAGADFEHVPAGDDIAGGELLEHEAREGTEV